MSDLDVLRGGRLAGALDETLQFTSSVSDDRILANAVRKINIVHLLMLLKKGLIKKKDAMACIEVLDSMPEDFPLNVELEDVHMNIEAYVSSKAGDDSGGQMNLGKSRNDQVATAIRMVSREILLELLDEIIVLERTLLEIAKANTDVVFPAYTHLQRAQVVTISHYFLAYHDAIARDLERLMECYSRVNASPMGAGAVATVILDLDREYVAHLLGFAGILENSIDAVTARDFLIEILSLLSLLMTDVERFANEIILWTSSEFSFIEIPDEFASTSSIMPQKKNAVVAEVIRSKSSMIFGDLAASIHMMKSLPLGYNLDYQDMTPKLWDGLKNAGASVQILGKMLKKTVFKKDQIEKGIGDEMGAADLANYLSVDSDIPFRKAHHIVGLLVRSAIEKNESFRKTVTENLGKTAERIIGKELHIDPAKLDLILDPRKNVESKKTRGGPSPAESLRMISDRWERISSYSSLVNGKREMIEISEKALQNEIKNLKEVK